jgi:hypothetical protein
VNSKPLRSFEDDLELATLAQERPVEERESAAYWTSSR